MRKTTVWIVLIIIGFFNLISIGQCNVYKNPIYIQVLTPYETRCGIEPAPTLEHLVTGNSINITWDFRYCGDTPSAWIGDDPDENDFLEFNLTDPQGELVISQTDILESELETSYNYIFAESEKVNGTTLEFIFQLYYIYQQTPDPSDIETRKVVITYELIWVDVTEIPDTDNTDTNASTNTLFIIIGIGLGGVVIYFLFRKPTYPQYCQTQMFVNDQCRKTYFDQFKIPPEQDPQFPYRKLKFK